LLPPRTPAISFRVLLVGPPLHPSLSLTPNRLGGFGPASRGGIGLWPVPIIQWHRPPACVLPLWRPHRPQAQDQLSGRGGVPSSSIAPSIASSSRRRFERELGSPHRTSYSIRQLHPAIRFSASTNGVLL